MVEHTKDQRHGRHSSQRHTTNSHTHPAQNSTVYKNVNELAIGAINDLVKAHDDMQYSWGGKVDAISGHINNYTLDKARRDAAAKQAAAAKALPTSARNIVDPASRHMPSTRTAAPTPAPMPNDGHPYHEGGIDCSGFVSWALHTAYSKINDKKGYPVVKEVGYFANGRSTTEIADFFMERHAAVKRSSLNISDIKKNTLTAIVTFDGKNPKHVVTTDGYTVSQSGSGGVGHWSLEKYLDYNNRQHRTFIVCDAMAKSIVSEDPEQILKTCPSGKDLWIKLHAHNVQIRVDPTANRGSVIPGPHGYLISIPGKLDAKWQTFSLLRNAAVAELMAVHKWRPDKPEGEAAIRSEMARLAVDLRATGDNRAWDAFCTIYDPRKSHPQWRQELDGHTPPSHYTTYTHFKQIVEKETTPLGFPQSLPAYKMPKGQLYMPTTKKLPQDYGI